MNPRNGADHHFAITLRFVAGIDLVKRRVRLIRLLIPGVIIIVFVISMQSGEPPVEPTPDAQRESLQELRRTAVWAGPLPGGAVQTGLSEAAFCSDDASNAAVISRTYKEPPVADVFSFYRPLLVSQGYEVSTTPQPMVTLVGIKPIESKFTKESWVNVTVDDGRGAYTVKASGDYRKVSCG